jgi:hypothetical protein
LELEVPVNNKGEYTLPDGKPYGPEQPKWKYVAKDTFSFYAPFISSAHRLKSGNTFVNSGPRGHFMEVTPERDVVWEYWNPYFDDYRMPDGTTPQPAAFFFFAQFRAYHIPMDHPALSGKEFTPIVPQPEVFIPKPPPGH